MTANRLQAGRIARTIEIDNRARMRVPKVEPATDFTSLKDAPPSNAKRVMPHAEDALLAGDIMHGQLLSGNPGETCGKLHPPDGTLLTVGVILHVDTAGNITGFDVRDDSYKSMTPQVASALKQWKFRVSYQGDHAIAADIPILLWSGTP
jgi:hypothetical protein